MMCSKCRGERRIWFHGPGKGLLVGCPRCKGTARIDKEPGELAFYIITVLRKGTKERVFVGGYGGNYQEAVHVAGNIWNQFDNSDRFRLTLRQEGKRGTIMSIN